MSKRQGRSWRVSYDSGDTSINVVDGGDLDEVVIDKWCHIERMGERSWFLQIGDAYVSVAIGSDGRPYVGIRRGEFGDEYGYTECGLYSFIERDNARPKRRAKKKARRK